MQQHTSPGPIPQSNDNRSADQGVASRQLPNRLLTAFEVAEFVGCHEETVRRAYLCGLLRRQRFGVRGRRFHPADVRDWIRAGSADQSLVNAKGGTSMAVRKICKQKGCRGSPRCDHPWWFDVMHDGKRWRMRGRRLRARCAAPRSRSRRNRPRSACGSRSSWARSWPAAIRASLQRKPEPPAADGRGVPRPLLRPTTSRRKASRAPTTISGHVKALKASLGRSAGDGAGEAGRHQPVQGGVPPGARGRDGQPRAWRAARGDQLGTIPGSAAALDDAVPSFRRDDQSKGRNETRPAHPPRRGAALLAACVTMNAAEHKCVGARDARSHHRRPRDVLPAGRDAAHPEPARGLGAASDRHPRCATPRTRRTGASRSTRRDGSRRS